MLNPRDFSDVSEAKSGNDTVITLSSLNSNVPQWLKDMFYLDITSNAKVTNVSDKITFNSSFVPSEHTVSLYIEDPQFYYTITQTVSFSDFGNTAVSPSFDKNSFKDGSISDLL